MAPKNSKTKKLPAATKRSAGSKGGNNNIVKTAKRIASSKMYTANGDSIRNLDSYMAAGGKPRNSAGDIIQNPRAYSNSIEASVRQNTDNPKYLHHYTTSEAASKIQKSGGIIKASSIGAGGSGTYLTAKPPRCNTNTLLNNNYDGVADSRGPSYVEKYIRLNNDGLDATRVPDVGGRDVWKVDGDVNLNNHGGYIADRSHGADNCADGGSYASLNTLHQSNADYVDDSYHNADGGGCSSLNDFHQSNADYVDDSCQSGPSEYAGYCEDDVHGADYGDYGYDYHCDYDGDY